ncbi:MAG TPA: hypothetical protein VHD56_00580 [Tepidisphaeraceae bacterium]|nr:hypothetical protein [Tepidisphaeraceae bacterium]
MSLKRIKQLLSRKPFEPFAVVTGDGSEVNVLSQEFAFLKPGGRTLEVAVPRKKNAKEEADFEEHLIDVFLIAKVVAPIKRNGNGHSAKK